MIPMSGWNRRAYTQKKRQHNTNKEFIVTEEQRRVCAVQLYETKQMPLGLPSLLKSPRLL